MGEVAGLGTWRGSKGFPRGPGPLRVQGVQGLQGAPKGSRASFGPRPGRSGRHVPLLGEEGEEEEEENWEEEDEEEEGGSDRALQVAARFEKAAEASRRALEAGMTGEGPPSPADGDPPGGGTEGRSPLGRDSLRQLLGDRRALGRP